MDLRVTWIDSTDPKKEIVEKKFRENLLKLFGNAAEAYVSRQDYHLLNKPIGHRWQTYTVLSQVAACRVLRADQIAGLEFKIDFVV